MWCAHLPTHRCPRPAPAEALPTVPRARNGLEDRAAASPPGHPIDHHVAAAAPTLAARTEIRPGARAPHPCPCDHRRRRRTGSRASTERAHLRPLRGEQSVPVLAAVKVVRPVGRSTLTAAAVRHHLKPPDGPKRWTRLTGGPSTDRALRVVAT